MVCELLRENCPRRDFPSFSVPRWDAAPQWVGSGSCVSLRVVLARGLYVSTAEAASPFCPLPQRSWVPRGSKRAGAAATGSAFHPLGFGEIRGGVNGRERRSLWARCRLRRRFPLCLYLLSYLLLLDRRPPHGGPPFPSFDDGSERLPDADHQRLHGAGALAGGDAEAWNR